MGILRESDFLHVQDAANAADKRERDKHQQSVYLCHKCSGLLAGTSKLLHGCCCISGWVRDWQEPISELAALRIQHDNAINNAEWHYKRNAPGDQDEAKRYLERADKILEILTAPEVVPA